MTRKKHFISLSSPLFPSPVCCVSSIYSFPSSGGHLSLCPSHPLPARMSTPPSFSSIFLSLCRTKSADSSGRDKVLMPGLKVTAPVLQPHSWGARDPSPRGIPRAARGERKRQKTERRKRRMDGGRRRCGSKRPVGRRITTHSVIQQYASLAQYFDTCQRGAKQPLQGRIIEQVPF